MKFKSGETGSGKTHDMKRDVEALYNQQEKACVAVPTIGLQQEMYFYFIGRGIQVELWVGETHYLDRRKIKLANDEDKKIIEKVVTEGGGNMLAVRTVVLTQEFKRKYQVTREADKKSKLFIRLRDRNRRNNVVIILNHALLALNSENEIFYNAHLYIDEVHKFIEVLLCKDVYSCTTEKDKQG